MVRRFARSAVVVALLATWLAALVSCQGQQAPAPTATSAPANAPAPTAAAPAAQPTTAAAQPTAAAAAQPTAAAAQPAAASEVIKLGIHVALSGGGTKVGQNTERFARLGMEDVNAKGGVKVGGKTYRFDAVTVDDKGTADGGRDAGNRLVLAEKVKYAIGPISTPLAGAQAITEPNKVAELATSAVDKSLGPAFPLTLQVGQSHNVMRVAAIHDWLVKEYPAMKRVAVLTTDDPTGHNIADLAEQQEKQKGLTRVATEYYPTDIKDFSPVVTRLLRQNPDVINIGPAGSRGPLLLSMMKTLKDMGFKGPVIGTSADIASVRQGAETMNNYAISFQIDWKAAAVSAPEKQLTQRMIDKYGEAELEIIPLPIYNAVPLLAQAMEKAGTVDDVPKVIQTLREGQWDTLYTPQWGKGSFLGAKYFGLPSVLEQPVYLSKVANGKPETFASMRAALP